MKHAVKHSRKSRSYIGAWPVVAVLVLGAVAFGTEGHAVADSLARALRTDYTSHFTTVRDPMAFLEQTRVVLPRAVISFTREDAVARELVRRSKSLSEQYALRVAQVICEEADALAFDPFMLLAVIRIESNYNHLAVSPVGAEGLMQLMPYTAVWFSMQAGLEWEERHSFDPVLNVQLGARYLAQLRREFKGKMDLALTAYNRGPSATRYLVAKNGRLPDDIYDFYAGKVFEKYYGFRSRYGHLKSS